MWFCAHQILRTKRIVLLKKLISYVEEMSHPTKNPIAQNTSFSVTTRTYHSILMGRGQPFLKSQASHHNSSFPHLNVRWLVISAILPPGNTLLHGGALAAQSYSSQAWLIHSTRVLRESCQSYHSSHTHNIAFSAVRVWQHASTHSCNYIVQEEKASIVGCNDKMTKHKAQS